MDSPPFPKRVHAALNGLCCLALARGPVRAQELARCARIPPAQAAKILYLLTWGGFVYSRRGSKGGYWLRRPPDEILIRDVMNFFHPPVDHHHSQGEDPVSQIWQETAAPSHQAFEQLTLADLIRESNAAGILKCTTSDEHGWRFFA